MAATPSFAGTPYLGVCDLTAVSACTTRAPTATASLAAANIIAFSGSAATIGRRIDSIDIVGASSSISSNTTAGLVQIWAHDGTKAYLWDEIPVSALTATPGATSGTFSWSKVYSNPKVLPAGFKLYASSTVATTASTNALTVFANGGDF